MRASVVSKAVIACLVVTGLSFGMKGLLEKKVYYSAQDKSGEASYWAIYFGDFSCKLIRKYPGEPEQPIDVSLNISLLSSGYVEARGYGSKGKIEATPDLYIKTESEQKKILIDDIDYVYNGGLRVRMTDKTDGELLIVIDNNVFLQPKMTMIRRYKMVDYFGEKTLKEDQENTEKKMSVFSFSKEGLTRALAGK